MAGFSQNNTFAQKNKRYITVNTGKGRIIGIDYGQKRTGIAVTDPLQIIATGLETVASHTVEAWLERYLAAEPVSCIVVGCPTMLDGTRSATMTHCIQPFINRLKKKFSGTPVHIFDERYTSKIAARAMVDGGMKKKSRRDKSHIDTLSAVILLQSYLESIRQAR